MLDKSKGVTIISVPASGEKDGIVVVGDAAGPTKHFIMSRLTA